MNLVKYEATRQALIECATFDEVKTIKDKAQALANYARLSKDNELEKRSVEIRERARIRMGEMSLALPKKSPPGKAYSAEDTPTIVGVSSAEYAFPGGDFFGSAKLISPILIRALSRISTDRFSSSLSLDSRA